MVDAGITLAVATQRLQLYLDAEAKVLAGQSFDFADGRKLTRADLREIRAGIGYWQAQIVDQGGTTPRARGRMRAGTYRLR